MEQLGILALTIPATNTKAEIQEVVDMKEMLIVTGQ